MLLLLFLNVGALRAVNWYTNDTK